MKPYKQPQIDDFLKDIGTKIDFYFCIKFIEKKKSVKKSIPKIPMEIENQNENFPLTSPIKIEDPEKLNKKQEEKKEDTGAIEKGTSLLEGESQIIKKILSRYNFLKYEANSELFYCFECRNKGYSNL